MALLECWASLPPFKIQTFPDFKQRGSGRLINYVREHALVPVIETGAGICHTYFDSDGDLEKGRNIVFNAKTRRVSVHNLSIDRYLLE